MTTRNFVAALILLTVAITAPEAQKSGTQIYSNVEYNQEGGDLLGFELKLTTDSSQAKGELKIYEGGCAAPIPLSGSVSGTKLVLAGASEGYGKVDLFGFVRNGALEATIRLEKGEGEKVHLKTISKPHC